MALKQRGFKVDIYESRPDMRKAGKSNKHRQSYVLCVIAPPSMLALYASIVQAVLDVCVCVCMCVVVVVVLTFL